MLPISSPLMELKWRRWHDLSSWMISIDLPNFFQFEKENWLGSSWIVKKQKIPNKIGLASQMSKVRIWLIIDQESGNQPRKNKRKAKGKLEEPQEELFLYVCYPRVGERPCSTFYVILRYTRKYSLVFTTWWIVAESTIS